LQEVLTPIGVSVVMEGRHMCMQMRGVEKQNSFASTSAMSGQFKKSAETRSEFLDIISRNTI
jgi:GTP cyclohydrolase I